MALFNGDGLGSRIGRGMSARHSNALYRYVGNELLPVGSCPFNAGGNGSGHKYEPHVQSNDLVILTCQCGDVQWKDRPQPEKKA
jgi:hypothetical protein